MALRDELVDALHRELVGPAPGLPFMQLNREEVICHPDSPRLRYGAGILFPTRMMVERQEDGNADSDTADGDDIEAVEPPDGEELQATGEPGQKADERGDAQVETDLEVNRANQFLPSALGLTALLEVPESLTIRISAAQYEPQPMPDSGYTTAEGRHVDHLAWYRIPIDQIIELSAADLLAEERVTREWPLDGCLGDAQLMLHVFSRPGPVGDAVDPARVRFVTFTLLNRTASGGYAKDEDCFFQCSLTVETPEQAFLAYPDRELGPFALEDDRVLALLYRHRRVYAVGHGCSADWAEDSGMRTASVWSSTLPTYEIKPILPAELPGLDLRIAGMAGEAAAEGLSLCRQLANGYEDWILTREQEAANPVGIPPGPLRAAAEANLAACRQALHRIRRGIDLLEVDAEALRAFGLMNQAMVMQHAHYQLSTDARKRRGWTRSKTGVLPERPYETPDYASSDRAWRPFQLAFILMTLRSMVLADEDDCEERSIVDLIWFPTGGGKTEAYLGLAAFTIFFRRLRNPTNAGTTALMRYTLRLLTTQQFQRAASLICACEHLRRSESAALGEAPITIGLWVGGSVTPNSEDAALKARNKLLQGEKENPFIVLSCPWCGVQMGPVRFGNQYRTPGYRKLTNPNRIRLICEDPGCAFANGEGLPLQVIDEHIYASPPTLLVGTVDKFAMLPWNPRTTSLFGIGSDGISPPELIIQDELHLISGPLGSMVGHYETVIDALTKMERLPAKVVASTATISRAAEQIHRLYGGRRSSLFPPQGLEAGDSFFARETREAPGRVYCGVFASGLPSMTTTEVRVLATLLQAPLGLEAVAPAELDPYWTLMVYFNSIRELGHAATLIRADIPEYISVLCRRLGLSRQWSEEAGKRRRYINHDLELTSRVQNSEITEFMERLFDRYPAENSRPPVDVCLATNMIQVGLDVSRLSLMAIIGQPKTTAEYIQASSRVGRSAEGPGLVVTLLSPSKPRDRSHIEHFRAFHQSIYRHVEPTSLTPFALPVAERALHALAVALARLWGDDAQREFPDPPSGELKARIREVILDRVDVVEPEERDRVRTVLDQFLDEWSSLPPDVYGSFFPLEDRVPLMYPSGMHPDPGWDARARPTPTSMRNVDANCQAQLLAVYPGT